MLNYSAFFLKGAYPSYRTIHSIQLLSISHPAPNPASSSLPPNEHPSLANYTLFHLHHPLLPWVPPTHRHSPPNHPTFTSSPTHRAGRLPRTLPCFILLPQRRQGLSIPHQRVFSFIVRFVGVDFEEMIKDNQEHGKTTKENGERVEVVVGYHVLKGVGGV